MTSNGWAGRSSDDASQVFAVTNKAGAGDILAIVCVGHESSREEGKQGVSSMNGRPHG